MKRKMKHISVGKMKKIIFISCLLLSILVLVSAICLRERLYYHSGQSHSMETVLQITGNHAVTSMQDQKNIQRRQDMLTKTSKKYPEMVAWLTIPGTGIDYPVMWSQDSTYYDSHSFDGGKDVYGTPYLASENQPDFSDDVSLIYGRDMSNGTMFHELTDFLQKQTFQTVTAGVLILEDCIYQLDFFACTLLPKGEVPESFLDDPDALSQQADQFRELPADAPDAPMVMLATSTENDQQQTVVLLAQLSPLEN